MSKEHPNSVGFPGSRLENDVSEDMKQTLDKSVLTEPETCENCIHLTKLLTMAKDDINTDQNGILSLEKELLEVEKKLEKAIEKQDSVFSEKKALTDQLETEDEQIRKLEEQISDQLNELKEETSLNKELTDIEITHSTLDHSCRRYKCEAEDIPKQINRMTKKMGKQIVRKKSHLELLERRHLDFSIRLEATSELRRMEQEMAKIVGENKYICEANQRVRHAIETAPKEQRLESNPWLNSNFSSEWNNQLFQPNQFDYHWSMENNAQRSIPIGHMNEESKIFMKQTQTNCMPSKEERKNYNVGFNFNDLLDGNIKTFWNNLHISKPQTLPFPTFAPVPIQYGGNMNNRDPRNPGCSNYQSSSAHVDIAQAPKAISNGENDKYCVLCVEPMVNIYETNQCQICFCRYHAVCIYNRMQRNECCPMCKSPFFYTY